MDCWTSASCSVHLWLPVRSIPSACPDACRHRRCPLSRPPSVAAAMMPQLWGLHSAHSSGTVSRTSLPSYREDSLVRWGARGATALCTSQLFDNRQKLLVQQIKKKAGFVHQEHKPSITLGKKCAAPLFFFTLLPFMIWPSRLMPIYQQRPDCVWR